MRFVFAGENQTSCAVDSRALRWKGKAFFAIEANHSRSPNICTADATGLINRIPIELDQTGYLFIYDVDFSNDGSIAVVGTAQGDDGRSKAFVLRLLPDHKQKAISHVWPYIPQRVSFADDGSIWTVGRLSNEENTVTVRNNLLRRFDHRGHFISEFHPLTKFRRVIASVDSPDLSELRASKDRMGWLTAGNEYIEFSINGRELSRIDGPLFTEKHRHPSFLLTSDNQAIVAAQGPKQLEIWVLDRDKRRWTQIELQEGHPQWGYLLGFDDTTLVVGMPNAAHVRVLRFALAP